MADRGAGAEYSHNEKNTVVIPHVTGKIVGPKSD